MNQEEKKLRTLLGSMDRTQKVYAAALIGWLAEDDAVVDQINAHLKGEQVTQEYWLKDTREIVYSGPGEGVPADSWPVLGELPPSYPV